MEYLPRDFALLCTSHHSYTIIYLVILIISVTILLVCELKGAIYNSSL